MLIIRNLKRKKINGDIKTGSLQVVIKLLSPTGDIKTGGLATTNFPVWKLPPIPPPNLLCCYTGMLADTILPIRMLN